MSDTGSCTGSCIPQPPTLNPQPGAVNPLPLVRASGSAPPSGLYHFQEEETEEVREKSGNKVWWRRKARRAPTPEIPLEIPQETLPLRVRLARKRLPPGGVRGSRAVFGVVCGAACASLRYAKKSSIPRINEPRMILKRVQLTVEAGARCQEDGRRRQKGHCRGGIDGGGGGSGGQLLAKIPCLVGRW